MLAAINLNYQPVFQTDKINDISTHNKLAAEFGV